MSDKDYVMNLTVGEFMQLMKGELHLDIETSESSVQNQRRYAYGIAGIASALGCGKTKVVSMKRDGVFGDCLTQIGKTIILDVDGFFEHNKIERRDGK